jgi:hypothetical protein
MILKTPKFVNADTQFLDPYSSVVSSTEGLDIVIEGFNLIPKFQVPSRSSLSYLQFLKQICAASPTHKSCINAINKFAFFGVPKIIKSKVAGIENEITPPTVTEKAAFLEMSKRMGLDFVQLTKCVIQANKSMSESGDAYIYCRLIQIEGLWVTHFETIEFNEFMYWGGKDPQNVDMNSKIGVWASDWTVQSLQKGRYKVVHVTKILEKVGTWTKLKYGYETIFHIKNGNTSKLYGEFDLYAILDAMLTESKEGKKILKTSTSAMTALYMLFLPYDPTADNVDVTDAKQGIRVVGTNEGKGEELVVSKYDARDGGKPELLKFDVHRDATWSKYVDEKISGIIHGFHNISAALTSSESRSTGLSQNAHIDELKKLGISNINPLQDDWQHNISMIFSRIGEITGEQMLIDYGIRFEDRIQKMIDDENNAKNGTTSNIDGAGN